jgi:hypothetical protein
MVWAAGAPTLLSVSVAFPTDRTAPATIDEACGELTSGCYVTDGTGLYRTLGQTADADEQLVCVEDCVSLEVLLVPLDTVLSLDRVARAQSR